MKSWPPVSLPAWQKYLNVEVVLISEFVITEIRITSTFKPFCQAARISFRKTSIVHIHNKNTWYIFIKFMSIQLVIKHRLSFHSLVLRMYVF